MSGQDYAAPVGSHPYSEKMSALAESFPTLLAAGYAGIRPWDPLALDAHRGEAHGERCAIQFLLSVWNPETSAAPKKRDRWKHGGFDLQEALGVWDDQHRAAFLAWASAPWWP